MHTEADNSSTWSVRNVRLPNGMVSPLQNRNRFASVASGPCDSRDYLSICLPTRPPIRAVGFELFWCLKPRPAENRIVQQPHTLHSLKRGIALCERGFIKSHDSRFNAANFGIDTPARTESSCTLSFHAWKIQRMYERSIGISSIAHDYSTLFGSFKCCTENHWSGDWCPRGRLSLIARGCVLFYERKIWRMLEYCISIIGMCNSFSTIPVSNESCCMCRRMDCFVGWFFIRNRAFILRRICKFSYKRVLIKKNEGDVTVERLTKKEEDMDQTKRWKA